MTNDRKTGRVYQVVLRRTLVQTQTVEFVADDRIDGPTQRRVAAAYADPNKWTDEENETVISSLGSDNITWEVTG